MQSIEALSTANGTQKTEQDLGPLVWVLEEFKKSLEGANKSLRLFVSQAEAVRDSELDSADVAPLRIARQHIHQASSVLQMANMQAVTAVVRAMENAVQRFVQRPTLCTPENIQVIERASFAISEYLEGVVAGKFHSAVGLFPQYREVQNLAGSLRIHPSDLWELPFAHLGAPGVALTQPALPYDLDVRTKLDQAILKMVKSSNVASAKDVGLLCLGFAAAQKDQEIGTFWQICAGFFEAIALEALLLDVYVKRGISRVLVQYTVLARSDVSLDQYLLHDLLFFCAEAQPIDPTQAPVLATIQKAYQLTQFKPVDYEAVRFGRFDPVLLKQARKRIAMASETWSALAGGDKTKLKMASDQFSLLCDSIKKLHPDADVLVQALAKIIEMVMHSGEPPRPGVAMEVATTVLYLQASYEDMESANGSIYERAQMLAARLDRLRSCGEPEPLESWMTDLYGQVNDRQTMGSVIEELRVTLAAIEKELDQYFRESHNPETIKLVPSQLGQLRGVFSLLGLEEPARAMVNLRHNVETTLLPGQGGANTALFEKIGNTLSALGFLVDMLGYQPVLARKLFVYDEQLGELRILMGQVRSEPVKQTVKHDDVAVESGQIETTQVAQAPENTAATNLASPPPVIHVVEDIDDQEMLDIFLEEAREVAVNGLAAIDALSEDGTDFTQQTALRRAFHTLKGSSRMVGLNEFGEAAWAMEQVLNGWLGEQKPASLALLALSGSALDGFSLWIEQIAKGTAGNWKSDVFRDAADALRLEDRLVELVLPDESAVAVDATDALAHSAAEHTSEDEAFESTKVVDLVGNNLNADWLEREIEPFEVKDAEPLQASPDAFDATTLSPLLGENSYVSTQIDELQDESEEEPTLRALNIGEFDFSKFPTPAVGADSVKENENSAVSEMFGNINSQDALRAMTQETSAAQSQIDTADTPSSFEFDDINFSSFDTSNQATDPHFAEMEALDRVITNFDAIDPELLESPSLRDTQAAEPQEEIEDIPAMPALLDAVELIDTEALSLDGLEPDRSLNDNNATSGIDSAVKVIGDLRINTALYNVYLGEADGWSRQLLAQLTDWKNKPESQLPQDAIAYAHSLAGSSATVGFLALSGLARDLEHALEHLQGLESITVDSIVTSLGAAEHISSVLHQFAAGFLKEIDASILQKLQQVQAIENAPESKVDTVVVAELTQSEPNRLLDDLLQKRGTASSAPLVKPASKVAPKASELSIFAPNNTADLDADIDAVDVLDIDLFPIFEEEAVELLPRLGAALRGWSERPELQDARVDVLRILHTLKGSARLTGAMRLGEMAHRFESIIEAMGSEQASAAKIQSLLVHFDAIQNVFESLCTLSQGGNLMQPSVSQGVNAGTSMLNDAAIAPAHPREAELSKASAVKIPAPVESAVPAATAVKSAVMPGLNVGAQLLPSVAAVSPTRAVVAPGQMVRVRSNVLDRLVNQAGEILISRSRLDSRLGQWRGSLGDLGGNLDRLRHQLRDVEIQSESQMQSRLALSKEDASNFDPLEFDRFTRVQELTRMMAESVNDIATVQRTLQRVMEGVEDDLIEQGRQTRELQSDLLRTRMVEFDSISERLYAVVRQSAKEIDKQVALEIVGGSIELDRGMLDRLIPAFQHLLRNSVAHGIETAEVRKNANKKPVGTIKIVLQHENNDIAIKFEDDGAGLDVARILAKAEAQNLVQPGQKLTDGEIASLIFLPGFTTAKTVTEQSGRGIGTEVVRSEVNALGGRIETSTKMGEGATFRIVLPLTTAVTQIVLVKAGEISIGIPVTLIETVRRLSESEMEDAYQNSVLPVGDEKIPFFDTVALLQASAYSQASSKKNRSVVILRSAAQRLALHVDEVLGNQEVVVKNLGPQLMRLPGLAGVTALASGAIVLIYNPVAVATVYGAQVRQIALAEKQNLENGVITPKAALAANHIPLVLVVDDSITVRRVTQRLLQREGFRVALAADGYLALEALQQEKPDVVLSDIEMPRMDGFELARNIRASAEWKDLPIIMITSRIADKHREHALELGVNHYLGKPYSEEILMSLVRGFTMAETLD